MNARVQLTSGVPRLRESVSGCKITLKDIEVLLKSYNHIYVCQNYSQFSISLPACSEIRP